ncbi:MAG: S41 family peptidase [Chitinophagaceae bacterium]
MTALLFQAVAALAQPSCDLKGNFDSVRAFMKENYAGYNDKVKQSNLKEFDKHTAKQLQLLKKVKNDAQYFRIINNWLEFFKDEHVSITVPFDTANGKLAKRITETESINLSAAKLSRWEKTTLSTIEGIYYTADTAYRVAVIKSDNGFRRYAGIILATKAPEWKPGDVKFELIPAGNQRYDVIWYNKFHHPIFSQLDFSNENAFQKEGWYKTGNKSNQSLKPYTPPFEEEKKHNAFFKQLDDQTSYLRIQSFDASYIEQIDSVVKANQALLEKLPYLVIDIRGNGGGADIAYRPLKKLVYTDPVKLIGVDLLATTYNIDATISLINSIAGIPAAEKKEYNDLMEKARASKSRMFDFFPDRADTLQSVPYPEKVAVIMNSRCASTAEQFILEARQSKKVTLFGTHTMGVLDYANVREKNYACPSFSLNYPTTRSRRVDIGQGIDNVGIMPDITMDFNKEGWLKEVVKTLKK